MTTYDFVASSLESLDSLQADIVVLPYFSDERPFQGAAGLIDWRLCGALTTRLMAGDLDGGFGEKGMLAAPSKLRADGLLLVGLGPSESFDREVATSACALITDALRDIRVSTAAVALPGRSLALIGASEAMQLWLEACGDRVDSLEEVSIIERAEEHRALTSLFDGLRRQAESSLD